MKIKTIIADDEIHGSEGLLTLLEKFCPEVQVVHISRTLTDFKKSLPAINPSLIFLDIHFGKNTVFEILEGLDLNHTQIIFVSAHDHALEAFEFKAIDYLLKPVAISRLREAVTRAVEKFNQLNLSKLGNLLIKMDGNYANKKIPLKSGEYFEMVHVNNIKYCTADGSYTRISTTLTSKDFYLSKNLKHFEKQLSDYGFIRIHSSFLVNKAYIKRIYKGSGGYVEMQDGKTFTVSSSKKEEVNRLLSINSN